MYRDISPDGSHTRRLTESRRQRRAHPAGYFEAEAGADAGLPPNTKRCLRGCNDARTGMPLGVPGGAMCVQRFDDSLNSAIHITSRILLRSSSMPEPRDPLLKVLIHSVSNLTLGSQGFAKFPRGRAWRRDPQGNGGQHTGGVVTGPGGAHTFW